MSVRYLLMHLRDRAILDWNLPLESVDLSLSLTAPTVMSATITHERAYLVGALKPYRVAIFADDGSGDLHGGILTDTEADGDKLVLTIAGYAYAPVAQPWTAAEYQGIYVDPLSMVRRIWNRIQSVNGGSGNLDLEVDSTTSKVTVGEPERDVNFTTSAGEDVSFTAGPRILASHSTTDLGKEIDDLMADANASYIERHWWSGETIRHRLQIDCPVRNVRRDDLRFIIGENVIVPPKITLPGTGYATEVLVQGAGEGRDMIVATSGPVKTDGLYRLYVHSDKSITSKKKAQQVASAMVKTLSGKDEQITDLGVLQHPNADFRSIQLGDVIRVSGDTSWIKLDTYARVTEKSFDPSAPMTGTLTVEVI